MNFNLTQLTVVFEELYTLFGAEFAPTEDAVFDVVEGIILRGPVEGIRRMRKYSPKSVGLRQHKRVVVTIQGMLDQIEGLIFFHKKQEEDVTCPECGVSPPTVNGVAW